MGFVEQFKSYVASRTDCPPDFHIHAALVTLATAVGNRVWCHGWTRPIYPNLWAVIIAPSGYGKSAPLDMGEKLLQKAGLDDCLMPNSFSYEALLTTLKAHPIGTFITQEFSAFLGMLARDYNSACVPLLTEVYDCPALIKRSVMSGDIRIEQPCVSILGASSPAWFADQFRGKDLEGGFLARFLFCPSTKNGPPVNDPGPPDEGIESVMADHLRQWGEMGGLANFSAAQSAFNAWDRDHRFNRVRQNCPPEFAGMRARAGALVKKTSVLFHISRTVHDLSISTDDLDRAIQYVTYTQKIAEEYLTNEVARDADESDRLRLIDRLRSTDGYRMPWSDLLRSSHMRSDKFARAVETLSESGRIEVQQGRGDGNRSAKWVSLLPSINGKIAI